MSRRRMTSMARTASGSKVLVSSPYAWVTSMYEPPEDTIGTSM